MNFRLFPTFRSTVKNLGLKCPFKIGKISNWIGALHIRTWLVFLPFRCYESVIKITLQHWTRLRFNINAIIITVLLWLRNNLSATSRFITSINRFIHILKSNLIFVLFWAWFGFKSLFGFGPGSGFCFWVWARTCRPVYNFDPFSNKLNLLLSFQIHVMESKIF